MNFGHIRAKQNIYHENSLFLAQTLPIAPKQNKKTEPNLTLSKTCPDKKDKKLPFSRKIAEAKF